MKFGRRQTSFKCSNDMFMRTICICGGMLALINVMPKKKKRIRFCVYFLKWQLVNHRRRRWRRRRQTITRYVSTSISADRHGARACLWNGMDCAIHQSSSRAICFHLEYLRIYLPPHRVLRKRARIRRSAIILKAKNEANLIQCDGWLNNARH